MHESHVLHQKVVHSVPIQHFSRAVDLGLFVHVAMHVPTRNT